MFRHQLLHQYFESHLSQQLKNIVKKKKLALIITCTLKPKGRNKRRSILDDRSLSSEFLANHSPVSRICFSTGPSNIPLKSGNIPLYVIFSWSKSLLISKLTFSGNKSSYLKMKEREGGKKHNLKTINIKKYQTVTSTALVLFGKEVSRRNS